MKDEALGQLMAAEIAEQPTMFERILSGGDAEIERVAKAIREFDPKFVLLVARGTSDHAALYAKYLIEGELRLPAGLVSMSTFTTYGVTPAMDKVLWIAVSQSGGSPDLAESTRMAASAGAMTVAVTNNPDSPLAKVASQHIDLQAGAEKAVAATKSYSATMLALLRLVMAIKSEKFADLSKLPALASEAAGVDVQGVADRYRFINRIITTSRGYAYPTAREAAIKIMETCYLPASAFSGADLLHGPMAMIDSTCPVIVIVPEGKGGEALDPVIEAIHERDGDLLIVGSQPRDEADAYLELPSGIDERIAPLVQILPLQNLALALATGRDLNPDAPRGLKKVTETM